MWKKSFQVSSLEFKPSYIKQEWPRIYWVTPAQWFQNLVTAKPVGNTFYDILWWTWNIDIDLHPYITERKYTKQFFTLITCNACIFYSTVTLSVSLSLSLCLSRCTELVSRFTNTLLFTLLKDTITCGSTMDKRH